MELGAPTVCTTLHCLMMALHHCGRVKACRACALRRGPASPKKPAEMWRIAATKRTAYDKLAQIQRETACGKTNRL